MKKLFFILALLVVSVAQAGTIKCDSVCKMGEMKFCIQVVDEDNTSITAFYSTPKGDNIEVNSYPYTKLHDVVLNVQNESLNASSSIQKKIASDIKKLKCSAKGSTITTVDAPIAAQFFN